MKKFRGEIQIRFQYSEGLGGRVDSAGVFLRLSSYNSYEFVNAAEWIEYDFGYAVEKGVRDGLSKSDIDPDLGIQIILESVVYDSVASSENSFYAAAKSAAIANIVISESRNQ
jgi:hypothetical protein